jgi:quercetin dioxygenase-like cupin family protein
VRPVDIWHVPDFAIEPHHPQVLRSDDGAARAVAIVLPEGDKLQEHETHEHTYLAVASGELEIVKDGGSERAGPGTLAHFSPGERREVRATAETRLILLLAPWPGEGHPSRPRA